jgi:MinD-like ATPase involved in chromosome partitioning or flagellar assembly
MFGRRKEVADAHQDSSAQSGGRTVAVWGPSGAPGRSTVAAALAGALAGRGRVVLVDADLLRGSLETLLGADVGGNIAAASRFPPPPDAPCAPDHLFAHRAGFHLLPGVPGPAQGVTVEPDDLAALLERLRRAFGLVVVDVGWALPGQPQGRGHLAALLAADLVLVVAAATRLGVMDLLLQYPVLDAHLYGRDGTGPPAWCVLNSGSGAHLESRRRHITDETGLRVVSYLPHDCTAVMAAQERHLPLTVARRDSPAAQALWRVAERVWHLPPRPRGACTGS